MPILVQLIGFICQGKQNVEFKHIFVMSATVYASWYLHINYVLCTAKVWSDNWVGRWKRTATWIAAAHAAVSGMSSGGLCLDKRKQ